jgi:hypothetical protein
LVVRITGSGDDADAAVGTKISPRIVQTVECPGPTWTTKCIIDAW